MVLVTIPHLGTLKQLSIALHPQLRGPLGPAAGRIGVPIVDIVERRHNSHPAPEAARLPFWHPDQAAIVRLNPAF
jgi:hypothetical protein